MKGQPVRFINGHNGRKFSVETRAKISAGQTGRRHSTESRAKKSETLRSIGHQPPPGSGCGSNGVPAPMEARLLAALPADWLLHLDRGIGGGAISLVGIDLVLPAARVAVEVDGRSHCLSAQKARDREKEDFMMSRGFRVIRVSNEQVRTALEGCAAFILAVAARPAPEQTARPW